MQSPNAVASKWATNLQNSVASITAGVNAVTVAPGQAAAAAQDKMRSRVLAAIDSGKWAARVSAVGLSQWQQAMLKTGIPRISDGTTKGLPKMQTFLGRFLPYVAQVQAQVRAMPSLTLQDRINRMVQNVQLLSQFSQATGS